MMAEKSRKNVIRLEEVDEDQVPSLLESRAAKALDLLCGAVSSPAAKSNGLSENVVINAIKKLKRSSFHNWRYGKYTPVWNISSKQELEQVGLDLNEIEGLASILPFEKNLQKTYKTNVSDQLIPEILFTLDILDYDEDKFRWFMSRLDNYPAVGVLLCEILTDGKLLEIAQQFLDKESTDKKREILLEYLKGKFVNPKDLNILLFASSCGQYIAAIVPKEINHIQLGSIKVSESDATALATVISHSSVVKELTLHKCGLNSYSIALLRDWLKNSDVKIRSLNVSYNSDIEKEGFRCLGDIVKKHAVEELDMTECGVSFGKLKSFDDASGNAKIRSLNVNGNYRINKGGFGCLGNIVKKHAVDELEMTRCGLSFGKLKLFDDASGNAKICSLDVSRNDDIDKEGFRCLGNIVKKHAVEELNMTCCGLAFGKLKSFDDASGNAKIRSLDISCNRRIDEEGFRCLGNIVKNHAVKELRMTKCGLSFGKLKSFDDASGNAKIKVLDISFNDYLTVNAICQLTLNVTDRLIAKRYTGYWSYQKKNTGYWSEQDIRELQNFIHVHHPAGLKVTLSDDLPELRPEFTSEEYLLKSEVIRYLRKHQRIIRYLYKRRLKKSRLKKSRGFRFSSGWNSKDETSSSSSASKSTKLIKGYPHVGGDIRIAEDVSLLKKDAYYGIFKKKSASAHERQKTELKRMCPEEDLASGHPDVSTDIEKLVNPAVPSVQCSEAQEASDSEASLGDDGEELLQTVVSPVQFPEAESEDSREDAKGEEMSPSVPKNQATESNSGDRSDSEYQDIETNISDTENRQMSSSIKGYSTFKSGLQQSKESHVASETESLTGDKDDHRNQAQTPRYAEDEDDKTCTSSSKKGHLAPQSKVENHSDDDTNDSKSKELSVVIVGRDLHVHGDLNQGYESEEYRGNTDQSLNKVHLEPSDKKTPHSELGVLIPRKIGDLVDEDSFYSREDSELISSAEEEQSMESVIPTETVTVTVGKASKTIEVGGCFVRFEAGSFDNPQEVTIKAEIDPSKWPPGREAVTPLLYISSKHLQREATVELHTWCEGEEADIDIMCYTKEEKKWRVIKTCSVDESRFIKFKLRHFCSIVATVRRWLTWAYVIKPVIYYSKRNFVIALLRDTDLSKKSLKEDMASKFGLNLKNEPFSPFEGCKSDVITSSIKSEPEEGFQFRPSNHYSYSINEVVRRAGAIYRSYTLNSQQPTASIDILIEFKNDDQVIRDGSFAYDWISAKREDDETLPQVKRTDKPCTSSMKRHLPSPGESTSESEDYPSGQPKLVRHKKYKRDKPPKSKSRLTLKGDVHGDVYLGSTGRSEKYKDVNAQTFNRGHLESENKNTSDIMKVCQKSDTLDSDSESET